jgi:hypothetical protein
VTGWWFSSATPFFSTNKIDYHDITEILLKATLNTITLTLYQLWFRVKLIAVNLVQEENLVHLLQLCHAALCIAHYFFDVIMHK